MATFQVIVASRLKEGWDDGTFLITDDTTFVIGVPFDRRFAFGLRRIYPITTVGTTSEVMRKMVKYALPPLTEPKQNASAAS